MILLKMLLLPISLIYGVVVWVRNKSFDWGLLKSQSFAVPIISVGNISAGGTGKTPHVEYITQLLSEQSGKVILSRGYGRATKGFKWVSVNDTPKEVGDEPLQYAQKFPDVSVAVQEDRVKGVENILKENKELIILDDAFQHRWVKPGLNIVLSTYSNLYINDFLLPVGRLREGKLGVLRADVIVVSKTPKALFPVDKKRLVEQISPWPHQELCFSYLDYSDPKSLFTSEETPLAEQQILLLTGIADAQPLKDYLLGKVEISAHLEFKDHHSYTPKDIQKILFEWEEIESSKKLLLTTEKDAVRLRHFSEEFKDIPICYLPVKVKFHEEEKFNEIVLKYVRENQTNS